ncbi:hypothetical protein VUR80DRAFT_3133 [Thermomyces stellatus]
MTTSPARSDASDNGLARPSRHKDRFSQEHEGHLLGKTRAVSASPLKLSMSHTSLEHLISSAMRHLPVPVLVLNNSKTVVYANEAIGTLLGIARHAKDDNYEDFSDVQIRLRGQTLCQVGVDMLQDGRLMWVSWDAFFDSIAKELRVNSGGKRGGPGMQTHSPSPASHSTNDASDVHGRDVPTLASSPTRDVAVDVVICGNDLTRMSGDPTEVVGAYEHQVHATMIVSAWEFADHQAYFTLTFTSSPPAPVSLDEMGHGSALGTAEPRSRSSSQASLALTSDASVLKSTQFPPAGPPSKSVKNAPLSHLQKLTKMKDFLLNSTQVPVLAMWKDGSAVFPNRASRKLCRQDISFDDTLKGRASLLNWDTYSEDFSRKLSLDEHPISVLLRTEEPFESMRIGFYDRSGRRFICDARGELIRDETGEVFAGLVSLTDVTRFTEEILELRELSEERFKQICNTMPQLVWTTTADAKFDFFNIRWYEYTGLTFDLSVGDRWTTVLHPDDRAAVFEKWEYCIKTGEAYAADYRVRSRNGDYRWFLARANPLRDREMGQIVKWFGTSTDVHETMEASFAAKRMRQQLSTVISHCQVTLFTLDTDRRISMLEGALVRDTTGVGSPDAGSQGRPGWYIGKNVYDVFFRLGAGQELDFLRPIDDVFEGKTSKGARECKIHDRSYRFEFIPLWGKASLERSGSYIEGVIGVAMDVTEQRQQEAALEEEAREKRQAIANETAAREANRLKSQFLANMSHEIRTPITGVLGMAEVLAAAIVDKEQREYLGNIQRSASALLTVVNDILDFSKVESGRLDMEEVEFSLSSMVSGVRSMLSFIASRKDLNFQYDVPQEVQGCMVIGDPGRVRQIIMNLLANSIKFTNEGYVRFSVFKESEGPEKSTFRFVVEDSGIGMTGEVKAKLFQPFAQGDPSTARKFGGTGLGLTICKNLTELMGGRIAIDSAPGKGTVANVSIPFRKPSQRGSVPSSSIDTLSDRLQWEMSLICNASEYDDMFASLPRPAEEDEGTATPSATAPAEKALNVLMPSVSEHELSKSERGDIQVLVVEDNAVNQRIATKFVTMLGFQVAAAWNGKEALDYIRGSLAGKHPKPNIILMDCQMPVVDGYECTHALRHHAPFQEYARDIPIIAMTASAIQGDREKCTHAGMDDYLSKPVRSKTLEKMLIKWSRTELPPDSSLSTCSELSVSDCPESLDHVEGSDAMHLDLAGLEDPSSSPLSEAPSGPVTPRITTNGGFQGGGGSWPTRRPSEDASWPWSPMAEGGDAFAAQATERIQKES